MIVFGGVSGFSTMVYYDLRVKNGSLKIVFL